MMELTVKRWTEEAYERLLLELAEAAEPGYQQFQGKLLPGVTNFLGVRLPVLKSIAKKIAKGDYAGYLALCGNSCYEEIMLQGLVIASLSVPTQELERYIRDFVPKINNWGVCDSFCMALKAVSKNPEWGLGLVKEFSNSAEPFTVRVALILLLAHYKEKKDLPFIFDCCTRADGGDHYYVNMAIAWLLSVCYVQFQPETEAYLESGVFSAWVYRKTLQKIIESGRVSPEEKERLRKKR